MGLQIEYRKFEVFEYQVFLKVENKKCTKHNTILFINS